MLLGSGWSLVLGSLVVGEAVLSGLKHGWVIDVLGLCVIYGNEVVNPFSYGFLKTC